MHFLLLIQGARDKVVLPWEKSENSKAGGITFFSFPLLKPSKGGKQQEQQQQKKKQKRTNKQAIIRVLEVHYTAD